EGATMTDDQNPRCTRWLRLLDLGTEAALDAAQVARLQGSSEEYFRACAVRDRLIEAVEAAELLASDALARGDERLDTAPHRARPPTRPCWTGSRTPDAASWGCWRPPSRTSHVCSTGCSRAACANGTRPTPR